MKRTDCKPFIGITVGTGPGWSPGGGDYLSYANAVDNAGGTSIFLDVGCNPGRLDDCEGLLVSGGRDIHPDRYDRLSGDEALRAEDVIGKYAMTQDLERDDYELELIERALSQGKPVLAICRGIQVLNVLLGRKLIPDIGLCVPDALQHRAGEDGLSASHEVAVEPDSVIGRIYGAETLAVNSRHHQGLTRDMLAPGLRVTAIAPDGIVEAVEGLEWPFVVAVQWHPERVRDVDIYGRSIALFQAFVAACQFYE